MCSTGHQMNIEYKRLIFEVRQYNTVLSLTRNKSFLHINRPVLLVVLLGCLYAQSVSSTVCYPYVSFMLSRRSYLERASTWLYVTPIHQPIGNCPPSVHTSLFKSTSRYCAIVRLHTSGTTICAHVLVCNECGRISAGLRCRGLCFFEARDQTISVQQTIERHHNCNGLYIIGTVLSADCT